jgi:hypothetical protein
MASNSPTSVSVQPSEGNGSPPNIPPTDLPNQQAVEALLRDPAGFIRSIVDEAAQNHLATLKEEAELRGAINAFRKTHPEFERFEPFIMQEVVHLIQNDEDGAIAPWDQLLEKASETFKQKFQETMKGQIMPNDNPQPPAIEGTAQRMLPEAAPSFTREQIANMSMEEFMKNETAINHALQNQRIR